MFRYSFHQNDAAVALEKAVDAALADGFRTADLAHPGEKSVSTTEMAQAIRERL